MLGYDEERDGVTVGLLHRPGLDPWDDFTCLNSLRDVEPTVGLIFDDGGLDADPSFVAAVSEDTEGGRGGRAHEQRRLGQAQGRRDAAQPAALHLRRRGRSSNCPTCRSWSWASTTGRSSRAGEISEPRLLKAVQQELGPQVARLLTPPVTSESDRGQASPFDDTANVGVPVAPFPRWLLCPYCRLLAPIQSGCSSCKLDPYRKDRSRYVHRICKKPGKPPTVVPARFLVACEHGHLDDFPWVEFVHRGKTDCRYELRLYELGASGEVADIQVQCVKCEGKRRRMSDAFSDEGQAETAPCRGRWPHLRKFDEDACEGQAAGDPARGLEQLVPGHAVGPVDPVDDRQAGPTGRDELGRAGGVRERPRREAASGSCSRGSPPSRDDADLGGGRQAEGGRAARRRTGATDLREPEWQVFSNPDPSLQQPGLQAAGRRSAQGVPQASSTRSSWPSGCGRSGP